ncbi:kinase-like domain-containing protein [Rhodocollybia butyracea]|uniref:Kinase-like domain-containing protein n=1 Tax=Rhodocollybia butyracea TaxID=206335 RepID=A0A9P5UEG3_9AGAR|nr:kinase-like domain-containing protein [Rhodocollybia butyracea]
MSQSQSLYLAFPRIHKSSDLLPSQRRLNVGRQAAPFLILLIDVGLGISYERHVGCTPKYQHFQHCSTQSYRTYSSDGDSATLRPVLSAVYPSQPPVVELPSFQWIRGDLIGKGSFGRVYWALNVTTGDVIAVKQADMPRGSNTLKDLDHPNIVQYLGFEESEDHISIFMQYIAGGSVGTCLKNGRFSNEVTKSFARQILEGLEYLHSRGIIHRDIKADNILVEKSGVCKISDFGISKQADDFDGRAFTGMRGTAYWMAPEAVDSNTKGYDNKIDIWSVGCVVIEMWTGKRPWYGEEILPVLLNLYRRLAPPIPPELLLSDEAMDFKDKVFARDPQDRPSAAKLKLHPYLVMEPGWEFDPAFFEAPRDNNSERTLRRTKSHSTMAQTIRRIQSKKTLPPVPPIPIPPPIPAIPIPPAPSTPPPVPPHLRNSSPLASSPLASSTPTPYSSPGPPIVFITPPPSPVRTNPQQLQFPDDSISSPSTTSSSRLSARHQRSFHIVNPDPDPKENTALSPSFVYNPPPLPDIGYKRLTKPTDRLAIHSPRRVPSTPVLSTRTQTSSRPRHASSAITDAPVFHSDSDSDDDTGTGWQRPPRVPSKKRESAWARAPVEDIYEHLQQYFSHHDIDKPIVDETESVPTSRPLTKGNGNSTLRPKKSIRMVAERQKRSQSSARNSKRATMLWDSHLEELDGTKP